MFTLESSWSHQLAAELQKDYMLQLQKFLVEQGRSGKVIYPPLEEVFSAFTQTPFDQVKVVIIGQDPYHGAGQAHGMCFSVREGIKPPPSLVNIYKELESDLGVSRPSHGHLIKWAKQGVLLLNSVLTVEQGLAGSHHKKGWEKFTDRVIEVLNEKKEHLVFILWGSPAQKKASQVDSDRHYILKSVHPSPLAAHRGFFGTKPFSKTNDYLISKGMTPIDWSI